MKSAIMSCKTCLHTKNILKDSEFDLNVNLIPIVIIIIVKNLVTLK